MVNRQFPRRAIHLDFHTMPSAYNVGDRFDAGEFAGTLKKAKVDYITVFARCNIGFAYYPTKIGIVHPGLKFDLLGEMVDSCHKEGIRVAAYFNAGLDHEHALRHREWCKVDKQGRVYQNSEMGHYFRPECLNTGYSQHLMSMVKETLDMYQVDGVFLDCFYFAPCYGVECLDGMKRLGMDIYDDQQVEKYAYIVTEEFCGNMENMIRQTAGDIFMLFNGIAYSDQPTHGEIEVLPTGGYGYDYLPFAIRYIRTLDRPFFTMTGRFHKGWGDFGGIRTEHSLLYDCLYSSANGGTCSVGDHLHPTGKLDPAVYDLIGKVYSKVSELEPWTLNKKAEAEIAVLAPALSYFPTTRSFKINDDGSSPLESIQGVSRMLSELKCQFDITDGSTDLSAYRVVIMPDSVLLAADLTKQLEDHLERGGAIVSSAYSGLDVSKSRFALDAYKIQYDGPETCNPSYFAATPECNKDLPEMLTVIYDPGIAMHAVDDAQVLARLYKPYTNLRTWDYYHEYLYAPPEKDTGRPAAVRCGNIVHFSFPIFASYMRNAVIPHKLLLRNVISMFLSEPLIEVRGLPSFGRTTITSDDQCRLVHLFSYVPEMRGTVPTIEEPVCTRNVQVFLRTDGRGVHSVYLAPSRDKLNFQNSGNYVEVTIPEVNGYQLVVFE